MKKFSKKVTVLILSLFIFANLLMSNVFATSTEGTKTSVPTNVIHSTQQCNKQNILYSDIIGWRYKSVNNKVYRRKYNYSKQEWIGEWELC